RLPARIAEAATAAVKKERAKNNRLMAGQTKTIQKLQDRISQLERGTTPQTDGLEFEDTRALRLRKTFEDDEIRQTRKGGDILQSVRTSDKTSVGIIIYECKRYARLHTSHARQAYVAKQQRRAHFAVLVTTGTRRGFNGLCEMGGVLCVAPLGVIAL